MKKLIFTMAVVAAGAAAAGVSFSYQGALKTAAGDKVEKLDQTISFRLYDDPTVSDALWGRQIVVRLDDNGLFNVELSDSEGTPLAGVKTNNLDWVLANYFGNGRTLYIGLDVVGSTGEIRPRQQLLNVPAAAFAADVAQAKNDFIVNGKMTVLGGSNIVPRGVIVMWSGSPNEIPDGWALCDGAVGSGTPDLRDRFIVGAGSSYGVGAKGGYDAVTLTVDQMPKHKHDYKFKAYDYVSGWDNDNYVYVTATADKELKGQTYGNTASTEEIGGNAAHENRPPYYALCFIMKL